MLSLGDSLPHFLALFNCTGKFLLLTHWPCPRRIWEKPYACFKNLWKVLAALRGNKMLLLFETAAGFALFKVLKDGKLKETETEVHLWSDLLQSGACFLISTLP